MKPSRLVRRRVHVHSVGDLAILERGDVVSDAEIAACGPCPDNTVTCDIVVRHESLGGEGGVAARRMRLRISPEWLEASIDPSAEDHIVGGRSEIDAIAVGDVTLIDAGRVAHVVGITQRNRAPVLRFGCFRLRPLRCVNIHGEGE